MKVKINTPYFDVELKRYVSVGEEIEMDENRKNALIEKGANISILGETLEKAKPTAKRDAVATKKAKGK